MVKRPEWNEYFGEITKQVALRSTCVRKKVGAIIVKDKNIIFIICDIVKKINFLVEYLN